MPSYRRAEQENRRSKPWPCSVLTCDDATNCLSPQINLPQVQKLLFSQCPGQRMYRKPHFAKHTETKFGCSAEPRLLQAEPRSWFGARRTVFAGITIFSRRRCRTWNLKQSQMTLPAISNLQSFQQTHVPFNSQAPEELYPGLTIALAEKPQEKPPVLSEQEEDIREKWINLDSFLIFATVWLHKTLK